MNSSFAYFETIIAYFKSRLSFLNVCNRILIPFGYRNKRLIAQHSSRRYP